MAGTANAATVPAVTAFPVVGNVTYTDDFGAPRPQGPHEGNDLMSIRHQPAVAFEGGTVEKHSKPGSCMLYLHGLSGMTYVYIHLNNDLGPTNDNLGGCKNGVSYAPGLVNGQRVRRGQLVGYVGDSGDANGLQPHLHFEVRTPTGRAIDPYPYLRRSVRLLYPRPAAGTDLSLVFKKAVLVAQGDGTITIRTRREVLLPNAWSYLYERNVTITVPTEALVLRRTTTGPTAASLGATDVGKPLRVWTTPFTPSWMTQKAPAGLLFVDHILLGSPG
ncbi:MAG TPA: peptidoglycan DD-metalloendopeptidase family protein [Gaiellaceae bacterium]